MGNDRELERLQREDEWEDIPSGERGPAKSPRAVVSVSLSRDDFERISEYARKNGMKTSEFIREAALNQVSYRRVDLIQVKVSGDLHTHYQRQTDRGTSTTVRMRDKQSAVTA